MKQHNIVIIGSGFGGQSAAINLLKQGRKDFVILERRSFMGCTLSRTNLTIGRRCTRTKRS
jgi:thioredoxin reductase